MLSAVARARVGGNEVTDVAPPGDFVGVAAGIVVRPPFSDFEVTQNQVHRDASASSQPSNGSWFALLASDHDPVKPIWGLGDLVTVRLDAARLLVFDPGGVSVSPVTDVGSGAAPAPPSRPRGSIVANVLTARGTAPAASVGVAGECLFNDNRVESAGARQAVLLATAVAIVHANRVRSGDVSIEIAGSAAAVLGNVTTGTIVVPGGLQPPWDALNVRG
jgi:hypothetical protein